MNKTKIDWADSTWNPVTGCLHGCEYCYARGIAHRFKGFEPRCGGEEIPEGKGTCVGSIHNTTHGETLHVFNEQPQRRLQARGYPNGKFMKASYPYGFEPTLHRHKLGEYAQKKGRTIFVCSMADLFGEFIPDEWIKEVFKACAAAPQHRYLFLTKSPKRYLALAQNGNLPKEDNMWYGTTATTDDKDIFYSGNHNTFVSIEPILAEFNCQRIDDGLFCRHDWVIIGAESGNRKGKVIPEKVWVTDIAHQCAYSGIPVFMKESLRGIMGDDFIQEFPWEVAK